MVGYHETTWSVARISNACFVMKLFKTTDEHDVMAILQDVFGFAPLSVRLARRTDKFVNLLEIQGVGYCAFR